MIRGRKAAIKVKPEFPIHCIPKQEVWKQAVERSILKSQIVTNNKNLEKGGNPVPKITKIIFLLIYFVFFGFVTIYISGALQLANAASQSSWDKS